MSSYAIVCKPIKAQELLVFRRISVIYGHRANLLNSKTGKQTVWIQDSESQQLCDAILTKLMILRGVLLNY